MAKREKSAQETLAALMAQQEGLQRRLGELQAQERAIDPVADAAQAVSQLQAVTGEREATERVLAALEGQIERARAEAQTAQVLERQEQAARLLARIEAEEAKVAGAVARWRKEMQGLLDLYRETDEVGPSALWARRPLTVEFVRLGRDLDRFRRAIEARAPELAGLAPLPTPKEQAIAGLKARIRELEARAREHRQGARSGRNKADHERLAERAEESLARARADLARLTGERPPEPMPAADPEAEAAYREAWQRQMAALREGLA